MPNLEVREMQMLTAIEEVLEHAHRIIWHGNLTPAESRLVWLQLISKMLETVGIDAASEVTKEHLGL